MKRLHNIIFLGLVVAVIALVYRSVSHRELVPRLNDPRDVLLLTGLLEAERLEYEFDDVTGEVCAREWELVRGDSRARDFWSIQRPQQDPDRFWEAARTEEERLSQKCQSLFELLFGDSQGIACYVRVTLERNDRYDSQRPFPKSGSAAQDIPIEIHCFVAKEIELPWRLKKLSALILLDRDLTPEELQSVRKIVECAIGKDEQRGDSIAVISVPHSEKWRRVNAWAQQSPKLKSVSRQSCLDGI